MREVLNLVSGGGGPGGGPGPGTAISSNNNNNDTTLDKSDDDANNNGCRDDSAAAGTASTDAGEAAAAAAAVVKMLSSQPGYLELSEERAKELLSERPIEELYEVEDQPFARGKYATVRRCRCRSTGQQFAAKVVRKRRRSADLRAEILHEVAVLDACRGCPRIVRLHRVFESPGDMVLLLELAAGGELQMVLDRDEVPEEREVARLMRQILHGLIYLHDINVAHLDLKPQNLVLTGDFPDCDVKLCDFGISRYLSEGADVREILGTPDYVAPEVLNYEPISLATDMWSVGVLLYVLLTGCSPFGGETKQETFCNISQCRLDFPDDLFEDVSDNAKDLMRKLIVKDPKHRLSASECLQHHWFAGQGRVDLVLAPSTTTTPSTPSTPPVRRHSVACPSSPPPLPTTPPPTAAKTTTTTTTPPGSPTAPSRRIPATAKDSLDSRRTREGPCRSQSAHALVSTPASRRLASADSLDALDALDRLPSAQSTPRSGISAVRRNTFLRNMESIAKRLSVTGDAEVPSPVASPPRTPTRTPSRTAARATAMQTMPVRSVSVEAPSGQATSTATSAFTPGLVGLATSSVDLRSDVLARDLLAKDKEAIFKYRKVFVLEDVDADDLGALSHLPLSSMSPPPSINGSTGSSVYSDTSISDSSSDTVSELSVDSSSDRSSIISLDHDEAYPWDVAMGYRLGLGLGPASATRLSYNVWERQGQLASSAPSAPWARWAPWARGPPGCSPGSATVRSPARCPASPPSPRTRRRASTARARPRGTRGRGRGPRPCRCTTSPS
ncbi:death-associated protein kinase related-like [Thrips palmi]|uniref:non-specific serine/threonine protein kinase n=1 Tax=Thrips palmi TaxID=161013 RepID=A0A6P8Z6Q5_THRPL|nr:death-associated protein kinase related-like [Thrips palmi]